MCGGRAPDGRRGARDARPAAACVRDCLDRQTPRHTPANSAVVWSTPRRCPSGSSTEAVGPIAREYSSGCRGPVPV